MTGFLTLGYRKTLMVFIQIWTFGRRIHFKEGNVARSFICAHIEFDEITASY